MRSDGCYLRYFEQEADGKKWKWAQAWLFYPGNYLQTAAAVPAVEWDERDSAPETANTFLRAKERLLAKLPSYMGKAGKGKLDDWCIYHAEAQSLEAACLVSVGIGFPILVQTLFVDSLAGGRIRPDSGFAIGQNEWHFEKLPYAVDSSGLKINQSRFRKKRFPRFFWGW